MLHAARLCVLTVGLGLLSSSLWAGEWYAGDLHCHSRYSDGDSAVDAVLASAVDHGLDFLALTDHDSYMGGVPGHWHDPAYASDELILLYGIEWTTRDGHANVWAARPFDYAPLWQAHKAGDPAAAAAAAHTQGALFSINHPLRLNWFYEVVPGVDCIEVWNGPLLVNNNLRATHEFYDGQLLSGRQIVAVGGSDMHHLTSFLAPFTALGNPTTWVYAESPDPTGILAGIAAGHVAISHTPTAPRLEFSADADGDGSYELMMGDTAAVGAALSFRIGMVGGAGGSGDVLAFPADLVSRMNAGRLTFFDLLWLWLSPRGLQPPHDLRFVSVMRDGEVFRAWYVSGGTSDLRFNDNPSGPGFYRVELFGDNGMGTLINRIIYGHRTAMSNPIYVR